MKRRIFLFLIIFLLIMLMIGSIRNSRHNLGSGGKGGMKSSDTSHICIFCHTSHSASPSSGRPAWNREDTSVEYEVYTSSTLYSSIGQPDGASKLCLSCHDGTISVGHVLNRTEEFKISNSNAGKIPLGRGANLGQNISDDHPISFDPNEAVISSNEIINPSAGDRVNYDKSGKIQCTSCHDVHNDVYDNFLVKDNKGSAVCKSCHQPEGFAGVSTHDISTTGWNNIGANPWPHTDYLTVGGNSCMNCHYSHNAGGRERLLSSSFEDRVCLNCHNGNTGPDIKSLLSKASGHRVNLGSNRGVHDPTENILASSTHVQCVDCHNPHKVNSTTSLAPFINGRLTGVSGMNISGILIKDSQYEYEVCLKCHGQDRYSTPRVNRQFQNTNIRRAFNPSNSSFHAVAAEGSAPFVPSLRPGWTSSSRLYCIDCHNNNNSRQNGGVGPDGPHGSIYDPILERNYVIAPSLIYDETNYDLCWKCHRPGIIMNGDFSTFKDHKKHIDGEDTPCSVCHDPHGSSGNIGLINFDTSIVFPNLDGELKFEVLGSKGYCYLQCHGEDHSPEDYER